MTIDDGDTGFIKGTYSGRPPYTCPPNTCAWETNASGQGGSSLYTAGSDNSVDDWAQWNPPITKKREDGTRGIPLEIGCC